MSQHNRLELQNNVPGDNRGLVCHVSVVNNAADERSTDVVAMLWRFGWLP